MTRVSRALSHMLRHRPERYGVRLDAQGWTGVDDALRGLARQGLDVDRALLKKVVARSDKQRFALSPDGTRIRANQGHSVPVDLGLEPTAPPPVLYHGTVDRVLDSIRERGLLPGSRRDVHLSVDVETAQAVGGRRGRPVVLEVDAARMEEDGHEFRVSENGVWLVAHVPARYLRFPD
jgi:putative RNA 2'-phosphotransferase